MVVGWFWSLRLRVLLVLGLKGFRALGLGYFVDRQTPKQKIVSLQDRAGERDQRRQERAADDPRCTEDRPG